VQDLVTIFVLEIMEEPYQKKNCVLTQKSQGKKSLTRYSRRWEDNINMDLREVRFEGAQWTGLDLGGVQFLENLKSAKNFDYEKVKGNF
jgi:uncharacterized protein YjbI with pentapeptide repeats